MAHPFSLRLPYVAKLDSTINPGQSLIVRGQPNGDRFDINFTKGPDSNQDDIVFHMSCRLKQKEYVMNTKENGQWGKEEVHKMHLEKGTPFYIRIRCHENHFEVFADGKELCEFKYRSPLHNVTHVDVNGQLTLNSVGWEGNYYSVPYKAAIPGRFGPGHKVFVSLLPEDDQFSLNLMVGEDIAFHFNPRFFSKNTVNNSQFGGNWGKEEVQKKFPFEKKKTTDVLLVCEGEQFSAYVNGEPYCTFAHRIDSTQINQLYITGKMDLQVINFE